jgi:hypothetical protein
MHCCVETTGRGRRCPRQVLAKVWPWQCEGNTGRDGTGLPRWISCDRLIGSEDSGPPGRFGSGARLVVAADGEVGGGPRIIKPDISSPTGTCSRSATKEAVEVASVEEALWLAGAALDWTRYGGGVAGERPLRAGQRRAALHAGMGDVLEIIRCCAIRIPRGCDGGDFHPVSAVRAREHETRQVRWGNVRVMHGALPGSSPPGSTP